MHQMCKPTSACVPWWPDHHISSPLNTINISLLLSYVIIILLTKLSACKVLQKEKHLGHQASSVRSAKSSPAVFTSSWTEKLAFKAVRLTRIWSTLKYHIPASSSLTMCRLCPHLNLKCQHLPTTFKHDSHRTTHQISWKYPKQQTKLCQKGLDVALYPEVRQLRRWN